VANDKGFAKIRNPPVTILVARTRNTHPHRGFRVFSASHANDGSKVVRGTRFTNRHEATPEGGFNPDISCSARNVDSLERRLAVGLTVAKTPKAD
jgi:hypothetical protein